MWFDTNKRKEKLNQNQNRWFYYINLAPDPRNDQKYLKTDHSIAICSIFYKYGIFDMVLGKSSCPDGSEYVCMAKGGRGCSRPSYRRPKLTLISKKVKWKLCRQKSMSSKIFDRNYVRKLNFKNFGRYTFLGRRNFNLFFFGNEGQLRAPVTRP